MKKVYRVRVGTEAYEVAIEEAQGGLLVSLGGSTHRVDAVEIAPGCYSLLVDGRSHQLAVAAQDAGAGSSSLGRGNAGTPGPARPGRWTLLVDGEVYAAEVGGRASAVHRGAPQSGPAAGDVRAPMPGLVVALQAAEGAEVEAGQALVIMEAMKMQMEIRAPQAGTVRRVHVAVGQEITGGQLLVTIA